MKKAYIFAIIALLCWNFSFAQTIQINKGVLICNNEVFKINDDKTNIYDLLAEKRNENMFFGANEENYSFLDTCMTIDVEGLWRLLARGEQAIA